MTTTTNTNTNSDHNNSNTTTTTNNNNNNDDDAKEDIKGKRTTLFENFCSDVTLHGFKQVCTERGVRRLLWNVIFLCAFVIGILLFYGVTMDYYLYKTYVTTNVFDFERRDIDFPTITVCTKIPLIRKGYERVRKLVNITEQEYEAFHLNYLTRYKMKSDGEIDEKVFGVLRENNVSGYMDALKLFEVNEEDMFHDPVARLFLTSTSGRDYPTCRYDYKYDCNVTATVSWRESLCFQLNPYEEGEYHFIFLIFFIVLKMFSSFLIF